ncbi:MAG: hypothetical protein A2Z52_00110 [Candidatus Moranbacteria bacterium RBG_19FT_COMBO_42_6]|nr:MAG: hypothetical protein A2Z52_00110 [Candidatus Moranbacteria bacterium RBG_19FT_COMBO_42_6]
MLGVVYFLFFPEAKTEKLRKFISQNILELSFLVAFIATAGSLFFSEVAGFEPCRLCWFQRIFMYPLVILLGLAWLRKDNKVIDYALSLSVSGALISLYHNYVYYTAKVADFCTLGDSSVSCTVRYFTEFGYITIPMMALTAFLSLVFLLSIRKIQEGAVR